MKFTHVGFSDSLVGGKGNHETDLQFTLIISNIECANVAIKRLSQCTVIIRYKLFTGINARMVLLCDFVNFHIIRVYRSMHLFNFKLEQVVSNCIIIITLIYIIR